MCLELFLACFRRFSTTVQAGLNPLARVLFTSTITLEIRSLSLYVARLQMILMVMGLWSFARLPIIVIFVGMLVNTYDGTRALSGSNTCHWYINEDLPKINNFRSGLHGQVTHINHIDFLGQRAVAIEAQVNLETLTMGELNATDIFDKRMSVSTAWRPLSLCALDIAGGFLRVLSDIKVQGKMVLFINSQTQTVLVKMCFQGTRSVSRLMMIRSRLSLYYLIELAEIFLEFP